MQYLFFKQGLGEISHNFKVTRTQLTLMYELNKFLCETADVVAETMLQAVSVGNLAPIKVRLELGVFDTVPASFTIENPATNMGFSASNLAAGLTADEMDKLEATIICTTESFANSEVREAMYTLFFPEVLTLLEHRH